MHGHRLGPEALGARAADDGEVAGAEVFHRPRHRADIARAARPDHNNADVRQHGTIA